MWFGYGNGHHYNFKEEKMSTRLEYNEMILKSLNDSFEDVFKERGIWPWKFLRIIGTGYRLVN